MEEDKIKPTEEKTTEKPITPQNKSEEKHSSSSEKQIDDKKDKKKGTKPKGPKKTEAVVNGQNLPISTKHAIAICKYIRGKNIDIAISMLEQVENFKKPIPMKGEIPHRKGKIMSGRYPINAVKEFIKLLKSLKANAIINELELEKYVILCKANIAARPYRRFGRTKFKRTHVTLKLIQPIKKNKKTKTNNSQNKSDKLISSQNKSENKDSSNSERLASNIDKKEKINKNKEVEK